MAHAQNLLPPAFAKLEQRLAYLADLQARGQLTPEAFQREVQNLTLREESGRAWWLGGAPGAWHWWDGRSWVPRNPPTTSPAPRQVPVSGRPLRGGVLLAGIGFAVVSVVCLLACGALLLRSYNDYLVIPKIVEQVQAEIPPPLPQALSPQQQSVRDELGPPEAFTLSFFEVALDDGSMSDVRIETWSYLTRGVEYTFTNGEQIEQSPIEIEFQQLIPVPYFPEQFSAYMSLSDMIAVAGLDTYAVVPLDKELLPGGEVYFARQLSIGMKDDELLYVEALVLDVEE